jgi:DNA polymerase-4
VEKKENHARIIFHIDMNQFFCSVACILNPKLRGKAFAIGRENTKKGVLSTASYEARKYGISSAMPTIDALKILPSLIVIHVDYSHYVEYHHKFINLISEYTKQIEVASIDECYIDVTELSKVRHPLVIAKEIQKRLLTEYDLPCSIGIAPTLYLAKMASDIKKPLGVTVIRKRDIENILYDLPVKDIFGIGKKTYPRLIDAGILTIGDFLKEENKDKVLRIIGANSYNFVYNAVMGKTSDVVDPKRYEESKSISTMTTFDNHIDNVYKLIYESKSMTREVVSRMKEQNLYCKTVGITLRDEDFKTITRQRSLLEQTDDFNQIFDEISDLIFNNFDDEKIYRLLGVGLYNLCKEEIKKEDIFTYQSIEEKKEKIQNMLDDMNKKYGTDVIKFYKK